MTARATATEVATESRAGGPLFDADEERQARQVVVAFHGALRAVRLYPVENTAVQKALADLGVACARIMAHGAACELRRSGKSVFLLLWGQPRGIDPASCWESQEGPDGPDEQCGVADVGQV